MTTHFMPKHPTDFISMDVKGVNAVSAQLDELIPGMVPAMKSMKRLVALVAPTAAPVLITGPSGSGKELVARAVHVLSGRKGALIAINCAAIPDDLLEGELFGVERGAFTGAERSRTGLIEQAEGGTLFLDEIGDMPVALQAKLLRVLETRMIRRVGGSASMKIDFRLVAATHRDLAKLSAEGQFREDLIHRLSVFPVIVPSLSERIADLPLIMDHLLETQEPFLADQGAPQFDTTAIRALAMHSWTGNIRELKTVMTRANLLFAGQKVTAREVRENLLSFSCPMPDTEQSVWPAVPLPDAAGLPTPDGMRDALADFKGEIDLRCYLRDIEVAFIVSALEKTNYCVSRAAERLRLRRTTLIEKLRKYGIAAPA